MVWSNDKAYILLKNRYAPLHECVLAYRRLSIQLHPDKGGSTKDMQRLNNAIELVRDPRFKEIYDERLSRIEMIVAELKRKDLELAESRRKEKSASFIQSWVRKINVRDNAARCIQRSFKIFVKVVKRSKRNAAKKRDRRARKKLRYAEINAVSSTPVGVVSSRLSVASEIEEAEGQAVIAASDEQADNVVSATVSSFSLFIIQLSAD